MVEEGWVDTLKKEVIEYTVDRDRHKEMLSLFKKVAIVLNDINDRVDRDNLKDYSDEEIKLMKNTLMKVEQMVR
jgi:nitrogenase molybdenum-iron protein alpha/beta subunit|tara:strand:+ start:584 stop:805 length:222 start_codon:yes stop_codon:yes gene_type:complete